MKKLTAIVLALVIALSVAVTAFAADAATYQCPHCLVIVEGEKEYNKHLNETCPVVGKDAAEEAEKEATLKKQTCPYGCDASFLEAEDYEEHLNVCPLKGDPTLAEQLEDFILNFNFDETLKKVDELLSKVDGPSILVTIIDLLEKAVTAIIDAI